MPEHLDRTRTPLLTLITLQSLDEDYEVASRRRRAAGGQPHGRVSPHGWVLVVLVAFGLLVAVAAVQTSREASVQDESRESLIGRIGDQRSVVSRAEQRLADLRESNTDADGRLTDMGNQLTSARAKVAQYGALSGFRAVTGPAVRVTLDSAAYADANSRVRDSDIALLVDGLWAAGAEAITINGQRVTARTGIRTSGDAIEVNGVGVAPPYTILAIGDTDRLSADFLDSASGQAFIALADQYAFRYDLHTVGQVSMAAAPTSLTRLRSAERLRSESGKGAGKAGKNGKKNTKNDDNGSGRG